MIYVVCFYWEGDRWRRKSFAPDTDRENYHAHHLRRVGCIEDGRPAQYVNNLFRGVKHNTTVPFRFICFTNEELSLDPAIEVRTMAPPSRAGVLPRLYMYSREAGLMGHQVLAMDLDIIVVGSLDRIMSYDGLFCARSKFKPGCEERLDGDIISFRACEETERMLWHNFVENREWAEEWTRGRERWWYRHAVGDKADRWNLFAPGQVVSYKHHCRRQGHTPKNARIVSCHGHPRPHQLREPWAQENWR